MLRSGRRGRRATLDPLEGPRGEGCVATSEKVAFGQRVELGECNGARSLTDGLNIALRAPWSSEAIDAWLTDVVPAFR